MAVSAAQTVYPGMQWQLDRHGKIILRLHYSADPEKGSGELIDIPELNMALTPWAKREYDSMTNKALYKQEYEIDGSATSGALIFPQFDEEASLENSFPIPEHWTRRLALDPHPSVPNAFLWCATDPWGDRWYYREFWPSRAAFRYENGQQFGEAGPCPEEDAHYTIKDYVATMRYFESRDNPENFFKGHAFDERIHARVIDYSARAFAAETREGQRQMSFQQVFEMHMSGQCQCEPTCSPVRPSYFEDSKKDHQVGEELVNSGLKPFQVMGGDGKYRKSAHIHIFRDRCPELIYELKNARRQQLTPLQAERMDPTGKPVEVRLHLADCLRYLEMSGPTYIELNPHRASYEPPVPGIGY